MHPETPQGGMRLDEYFPPERLAQMADYIRSFAERFGISGFSQRNHIPNTSRALALAEVARDEGKLDAFRQRAMEAHWRDGMNLESDDDLRAIARDAGLSDDAVERSASDPQYIERVDAIREEAEGIRIRGIPTFVIGNLGLSGCQPYEMLVDLAKRALGERPSRPPSPDVASGD